MCPCIYHLQLWNFRVVGRKTREDRLCRFLLGCKSVVCCPNLIVSNTNRVIFSVFHSATFQSEFESLKENTVVFCSAIRTWMLFLIKFSWDAGWIYSADQCRIVFIIFTATKVLQLLPVGIVLNVKVVLAKILLYSN